MICKLPFTILLQIYQETVPLVMCETLVHEKISYNRKRSVGSVVSHSHGLRKRLFFSLLIMLLFPRPSAFLCASTDLKSWNYFTLHIKQCQLHWKNSTIGIPISKHNSTCSKIRTILPYRGMVWNVKIASLDIETGFSDGLRGFKHQSSTILIATHRKLQHFAKWASLAFKCFCY